MVNQKNIKVTTSNSLKNYSLLFMAMFGAASAGPDENKSLQASTTVKDKVPDATSAAKGIAAVAIKDKATGTARAVPTPAAPKAKTVSGPKSPATKKPITPNGKVGPNSNAEAIKEGKKVLSSGKFEPEGKGMSPKTKLILSLVGTGLGGTLLGSIATYIGTRCSAATSAELTPGVGAPSTIQEASRELTDLILRECPGDNLSVRREIQKIEEAVAVAVAVAEAAAAAAAAKAPGAAAPSD